MSELKPCPFCGGEAFVSIVGVSCSKCPAAMVVDANATEQDAIDAWNTRANDDSGGYDPLGDDDYDW